MIILPYFVVFLECFKVLRKDSQENIFELFYKILFLYLGILIYLSLYFLKYFLLFGIIEIALFLGCCDAIVILILSSYRTGL